MISPEEVRRTREAVKEYQELSLFRRLGRRALSKHPSRQQRERLRRYDLRPAVRVAEDVLQAIYWTRRLNRTPRATLGGAWRTSTEQDLPSTIPVDLDNLEDIRAATLLMQLGGRETMAVGALNGIGFYVDRYYRLPTPTVAAPIVTQIGVVAFQNSVEIDARVFTAEDINGMDPMVLEDLEALAAKAQSVAFNTYRDNRPERVP